MSHQEQYADAEARYRRENARLYGSRSKKNRDLLEAMKKAAEV